MFTRICHFLVTEGGVDIAGYYLRLEGNRLICPDCFKANYGGEVGLDMILTRETVEKKCHLFFCDECREQIC